MANSRKGTHAMKIRKPVENNGNSEFFQTNKKLIATIAAVLVVVIVAVLVLNHLDLIRFNGHQRYYNGVLYGVSDNDIIVNADRSDPEYFKIGTYTPTDKYELDPTYDIHSDDNIHEWTYRPNADGISFVYVCGVSGTAEEALGGLIDTTANYNEEVNGTTTEEDDSYVVIEGTTASGLNYKGVFTAPCEDSENSNYYRYMDAYVDCGKRGCVLIMVYSTATTEDGFADEATFRSYIEEAASGIALLAE